MQRLKQWELKRAIYEKQALAKPETAKTGPHCTVSKMEAAVITTAMHQKTFRILDVRAGSNHTCAVYNYKDCVEHP